MGQSQRGAGLTVPWATAEKVETPGDETGREPQTHRPRPRPEYSLAMREEMEGSPEKSAFNYGSKSNEIFEVINFLNLDLVLILGLREK